MNRLTLLLFTSLLCLTSATETFVPLIFLENITSCIDQSNVELGTLLKELEQGELSYAEQKLDEITDCASGTFQMASMYVWYNFLFVINISKDAMECILIESIHKNPVNFEESAEIILKCVPIIEDMF